MDAIVVKYIGPSLSRGSRMKASIAGKPSITRPFDSELSMALNARQCASDLIRSLQPNRALPFWVMGNLGADYVFVACDGKIYHNEYSIDTRSWTE